MRKTLFVIFIISLTMQLNALGVLRVEYIKELPATHMNLEVRDADGKFAPVLIVKTELKSLGFKNIGRKTKHSPIYEEAKNQYKFYMNDNQRVVEITHSEYEPFEVRLLADFGLEVKAKRVYEMVLDDIPEKKYVPINIVTKPEDAKIFFDNKELKSNTTFNTYIGEHTINIQRNGYISISDRINISESKTLFDYKLERIGDIKLRLIDKTDYSNLNIITQLDSSLLPTVDDAMANLIAKAIGYYFGQSIALDKINNQFPEFRNQITATIMQFDSKFLKSIQFMDFVLFKQLFKGRNELIEFKKVMFNSFGELDLQYTHETAIEALEEIDKRINGIMDEDILTTFLIFNPEYYFSPSKEFTDGWKEKFETDGSGKSNGVKLSLYYPRSWEMKEAERPHIVKKFSHPINNITVMLAVLPVPIQLKLLFNKGILEEFADDKEIMQEMIPDGSAYVSSGYNEIEGLPGYWIRFKSLKKDNDYDFMMESIIYSTIYNNKLINLQCGVISEIEIDNEKFKINDFEKFKLLFKQIENSITIDKYLERDPEYMKGYRAGYWLAAILLYFFTWLFWLFLPLLIRFVFVRKPLSKKTTYILINILFAINIILELIFQGRIVYFVSIFLVYYVSLRILRFNSRRK